MLRCDTCPADEYWRLGLVGVAPGVPSWTVGENRVSTVGRAGLATLICRAKELGRVLVWLSCTCCVTGLEVHPTALPGVDLRDWSDLNDGVSGAIVVITVAAVTRLKSGSGISGKSAILRRCCPVE